MRLLNVRNNIFKVFRCLCSTSDVLKVSTEDCIKVRPHVEFYVKGISLDSYFDKLRVKYDTVSCISECSKEAKELAYLIKLLDNRHELLDYIWSLSETFSNDMELQELAQEEKASFEQKLAVVESKIINCVVPQDTDNFNSVLLEVKMGVGGQEAMLFAKQLFEMYNNYAIYKGWSFDVVDYQDADLGGIRYAGALIDGANVFRHLRHEAGVHRVQRIPSTEKGGRLHTSTASVIALPQPDNDIDVQLESKDLRVETKRATGAGGQHVNTTNSAVRIVHIPTGIEVNCQMERSQIKNRQLAMSKLRALLYERELNERNAVFDKTRKTQVKSNYRNEKVRTYNYQQDRVTDHRLQTNYHNLKGYFVGGLDLENMINQLEEDYRFKMLLDHIKRS